MSVSNGQKANATTFNNAFASKTTDNEYAGVQSLNNTSDPDSGAQIYNAQRAINLSMDTLGLSGETDTAPNTYSSHTVIADGDDRKVAIGKLDQSLGQAVSAIAGKVTGPGSSTNNTIARFDGVDGNDIQGSGVTIDDSDNMDIPGDLVVQGNLTVNGTQTVINTADLDVEDQNITVNKGGNDTSAIGAGLTVERTSTHGTFLFDPALTSKWKLGLVGSEAEVADVSSTQTFTNKTLTSPTVNTPSLAQPSVTNYVDASEQGSAPSTPGSGVLRIYAKNDKKLYTKDSTGLEVDLSAGGSSIDYTFINSLPAETSVEPTDLLILGDVSSTSADKATVEDVVEAVAATQSDQETGSATDRVVTPARQQFHPSASKGWVSFTGSGTVTIFASYNVSSVSDNGVGDYTINFSNSFSSGSYVGAGIAQGDSGIAKIVTISDNQSPDTSYYRIEVYSNSFTGLGDSSLIHCVFFGDL
jgi:hypothetical protein